MIAVLGKKIAIFLGLYGEGGAERVLFSVAEELLRHNVLVDVVVCRLTESLRDAMPEGARLHLLNRHPAFSVFALRAYVKRNQPDAVISTLIWPNVVNVFTKRAFGLSYTAIVREANTLPQQLAFRPLLDRMIASRLVRHFYPKADCVVAVSEEARQHLQSFLNSESAKLLAIANPLPLTQIQKASSEDCAHPWLSDKKHPVILAAGRLMPQKGFDVLLRAFASLNQEVRLIILGEGPERQSLVKLAKELGVFDRVSLAGFEKNPYRYMARADLFVLSSYHEGMPNVLLQALACGCRVVSTDCPSGPKEVLQDGQYGALAKMGDVTALAQGMQQAFLSEPDMDARMAYLQRYSIERITERYCEAAGVRYR